MKPLFVACAARTPLLACGLLAAAAGRARRVARLLDGWERRQKGGWTIDMEGKNHHIILIIYIYININIDIYYIYIYLYICNKKAAGLACHVENLLAGPFRDFDNRLMD